jgi:lysophospholipase L1-like esterase
MHIEDSAKTILCYGDSNTWGRIPKGGRYPRSKRWVTLLQDMLGDNYEVIPEGLPARTFVAEDARNPYRTGITQLHSILKTNDPIDVVVIMLGTNDSKTMYGLSADSIAEHLQQTISFIREEKLKLEIQPEIIIVCPPAVIVPSTGVMEDAWKNGPTIFRTLPGLFHEVCLRNACRFVDANKHVVSSGVDGFHLDEEEQPKLATALKNEILKI